MIYTNIVIPVFTYCGTVNLYISRTSLGKLDRIHERAVGIISKTNTVPMTDYFESLSHPKLTRNNKLSIALPRVRTKAAQNVFYYQGEMIYNSLTRDVRMQENENVFLKRLRNFNF